MTVLASFIGINQYADARIRDLTGATRDAQALWALFTDNIPEIKATLLTDAKATFQDIRISLDETLDAAGPDDIAIVSFAGHGTQDHRLVVHDTVYGRLDQTTIPMEDLATRFRRSQAKIILCILDCCFSGGAPARVLEQSPVSRDFTDPFQLLAGKGRILIAASNVNEPAYETPGTGHGLLTKALLDVFQNTTDTDVVNLQTAISSVMEIVRAEAARIGVIQTPVVIDHVEGGISFPSMRPGATYFSLFPEALGTKIGSGMDELRTFGLPADLIHEWTQRFSTLNQLQLEAVNEYRILDGQSLLVVAPTSSGKTFIGELAAALAVISGRKAVFLLPYRSLVNEKYDQFTDLYADKLGMRIVRCTGDYTDQGSLLVQGKYDIALLTYEMFLNLLLGSSSILNQIGLIVLDEAQFITEQRRGITVELLLTSLLTAREKGITPQLITLSAVIGNIQEFDAWLGCKKLVTDQRPIPLIEGVLDRSGVFQFLDTDGTIKTEQLLPPGTVRIRKREASAQDVIVPLVRMLISNGEKIIIFRNRKGPAQGCAKYLAEDLGLPPASKALDALPNHDLSSASVALRGCLEGGTAFHNTNLTREEKAVVEQAYREKDGEVHVLAATTTVAAGINTPASTVILAEQEFVGDDGRVFTVAEYKNMAGRAGRLGYNEKGKAIVLANNTHERQVLFDRYVMGQLEPLGSSFDPDHLETWVIRLLVQVDKVKRESVSKLLANTYGGYLAIRRNPDWHIHIRTEIEHLLERMIALELVEQEGEFVCLTLLGQACGKSSLSFESSMRLVEIIKKIQSRDLAAEQFLAILQILEESDGGYTPMFKRGMGEGIRPRQAAEYYGLEIVQNLQRFVKNQFDYWARCKRAAVLWDWTHGVPVEAIELTYSINPYSGRIEQGDIRKFADATKYHLRSAYQIATLLLIDKSPSEEAIECLLTQLEFGLPTDALDLIHLPVSLARGEYLALYGAGIKTPGEYWTASYETSKEVLGTDRANQLEKYRVEK